MLEIALGLGISIAVGYLIFKGFSATGVLLSAGLLLLAISVALGNPILPTEVPSTGQAVTDIFEYVRYLLNNRGGGLGMMIMVLCGFASYMSHIGANTALVNLVSRPLSVIKSPYILLVAAYFVSCGMSLAVSSATGLGVLLMATLFPLMINLGISKGAAAAVCASPAALILSPTSGDVVMAAQAANLPLIKFAFKLNLPLALVAIGCMGITHFFWQQHCDKSDHAKATLNPSEPLADTAGIAPPEGPAFYAILPFLPILGVLIFDGNIAPLLDIVTIIVICLTLTAALECIRWRNLKNVLEDLHSCWCGMADAFANVIMLLVGAGIFAQGLITVGFIATLIDSAQSMGNSGIVIMLALVVITALASITTGSGNAPFYAFVELIPKLAQDMGLNPAYLVIPMLQASNLGRTISPVAGVVVVTAGMSQLSPFEIVKRTSLPCLVGLMVILIASQLTLAP